MKGLLRSLMRRFRNQEPAACPAPTPIAPGPAAADCAERDRRVALELCEGLDRAMELGLWSHAERVATTALRWAPTHAGLSERLARLRLVQSRPETALAIIDACSTQRASLRLLRAVCLLQVGRPDEAHADLHRWSRRASAPLDARRLLALLDWANGDAHAAIESLLRNLTHLEDPLSLATLVLIAVEQHRPDQATRWSERLREATGWMTSAIDCDVLLESLGMPGRNEAGEPSETQVEHLATELTASEPSIRILVEAQQREPNRGMARLLVAAIERALPELRDQACGFESLARLALIHDEPDVAIEWARRGVEIHPMSAPLSMILDQAQQHRPVTGPTHDEPHGAEHREKAA